MNDSGVFANCSLRKLHGHLGLRTQDVRTSQGTVDPGAWLVQTGGQAHDRAVLVRIVTIWAVLWALLWNRLERAQVLLVDRGAHRGKQGGAENPDVILDWETYTRMVAGLAEQQIPAFTDCSESREELG